MVPESMTCLQQVHGENDRDPFFTYMEDVFRKDKQDNNLSTLDSARGPSPSGSQAMGVLSGGRGENYILAGGEKNGNIKRCNTIHNYNYA